MNIEGIDVVFYWLTDLDRALEFYTEAERSPIRWAISMPRTNARQPGSAPLSIAATRASG